MSSEGEGAGRRPGIITTVLATIGGLALLSILLFFIFVFLLVRSGIEPQVLQVGPGVGILEINGVISRPEPYLKAIKQFRDNDNVKAVVVRINSPGGAVGASQELYQELGLLDKEKPVVASLCSVAASGAYYAALGARQIISDPGTLTGSIGVIMHVPNIGPLLEKLGIKSNVIKSGRFKDMGSMTRDITNAERQIMQGVLDDVHRQFIEAVARSRKIQVKDVESIADGRVFTGRQALNLHLVDKLGNFSVAVNEAAALGGIKGEPALIYPKKDKLTVLRQLIEEGGAQGLSRFFQEVMTAHTMEPS